MSANHKEIATQAEADLVTLRIIQLSEKPLSGQINGEYLKSINQHIFQDMPKIGFTLYTPGIYRPEVPQNKDWIKRRRLESINDVSIVSYSNMDKKIFGEIDNLLISANDFKFLALKEFSEKISQLYVALDYIHPFPDGNSRTLRLLTQLIAKEAGYHIGWERFNLNTESRDILYLARDLSVCEKAIKLVNDEATKRDLYYTLDRFANNKKLTTLLPEVITPYRAYVFKMYNKEDALKICPELIVAYEIIDKATKYFQQDRATADIRNKVQQLLDKGVSAEKLASSLRSKKRVV